LLKNFYLRRSKAAYFMTLEITPAKKNSAASYPSDGRGSMGIEGFGFILEEQFNP
jgi:hypothetical protein